MADRKIPQVSIILPCRNEVKSIRSCLESVITSDFPKDRLELLIVDGLSDDGTVEIIQELHNQYPWIQLLINTKKTTPAGMNVGIRSAAGHIIIRVDAHTVYPPNYISELVEWLERSEADNVGGVCVTRPANQGAKAHAIAFALSHPWGVGNSYFRIGATAPKWVDTVPFGCYRREVFDKIGLYDEALVRNQDDELNHRLIKHGGRILLVPHIVSFYTARESLGKVWAMYYQYGYFKPLAARKLRAVPTVRQLIPAAFVMSLGIVAALALWFSAMKVVFCAIVLVYILVDIAVAIRAVFKRGMYCGIWSAIVFPVIHISYGVGYLKGLLDFIVLQKKELLDSSTLPLSR